MDANSFRRKAKLARDAKRERKNLETQLESWANSGATSGDLRSEASEEILLKAMADLKEDGFKLTDPTFHPGDDCDDEDEKSYFLLRFWV